ncbi:MAG: ABC transporter ATP-binding protein [Thermoleophilia bacterium]|nr:ABC transporter ATP-binding protein [Thermoleophilia bacterium]
MLVELRGLGKRFPVARDILRRPTRWLLAVDDVNLDVHRGETLGLIGESGCGKSTLARLILALVPSTSGSAVVDGIRFPGASREEMRRFRRRVQIIFQDPFGSLDPRMKVEEIITEGLSHERLRRAERRERAKRLLELVELPVTALGRYPHEFSGGQRQRISIARALAPRPILIVADEPVSALDVSVQGTILNLLVTLQRELSLTCIFISHDISVVRHVADRIAVMHLGQIVEIGDSAEILRRPLHPYTQALLSSVPRFNYAPLPPRGEART